MNIEIHFYSIQHAACRILMSFLVVVPGVTPAGCVVTYDDGRLFRLFATVLLVSWCSCRGQSAPFHHNAPEYSIRTIGCRFIACWAEHTQQPITMSGEEAMGRRTPYSQKTLVVTFAVGGFALPWRELSLLEQLTMIGGQRRSTGPQSHL